ncbi:hypothetical protein QNI16_38080 [Cytophagaceae bacterium YF14B1]|uniref:Uncharacterized protein n=1 Tax=Xanthocytophaga flava TaxID=3048013 RepID=A0AAE3QWK8_9BACT|nr:hypothetical protein [Xanthocytophaga flavus]MDJ1486351.1 hypothetical protein [Xanthocytophaga flavus]
MRKIMPFLILFISLTYAFGQTRKDSLIVFVGEKIEVKYSPEEEKEARIDTIIKGKDTSYVKHVTFRMDNRYIAKYRVLQLVHGSYTSDTIEFIAFDHYGDPAFSNFKTVLLFVSKYGDKLYHEKYQYFALYLTESGKWASPYASGDYNHPNKDHITVKPEKIPFKERVSIPVDKLTKEDRKIWYPEPYYKIENRKAIAIYGNYVDDLFKLKQQTILKARGIY